MLKRTRATPGTDVFVGIASFGDRAHLLKAAVTSLINQVDRIGVYLNNYPRVPDFLDHPRIDVVRSDEHGDLRDNGKFFFVDKTNCRFYASADDDLIYPPNYIESLRSALYRTGAGSAVGVHGAIFPHPIIDFFRSRHVYHYRDSLQHIMPVHLVGTGTILFDQSEWGLRFEEFGQPGMADIWFARSAKRRGSRLFVVNRDKGWLRDADASEGSSYPRPSLYSEFRLRPGRHVALLEEMKVSDSGYVGLIEAISASDALTERLTIMQALALDYVRQRLGLPPLPQPAGEALKQQLVRLWAEWPAVHPVDERFISHYAECIALILARATSARIAAAAIDGLQQISSLRRTDKTTWNSLPYSLRFDSRGSRMQTLIQSLTELAAESSTELRPLWSKAEPLRESLSPRVALAFEREGIDTDFQTLPRLAALGDLHKAGLLLRDLFESKQWSVHPNVQSWRGVFGKDFDSKPVQMLLAYVAVRGGHRSLADWCLHKLRHQWPADPDVRLMAALVESCDSERIYDAMVPVAAELDRILNELDLRPYKALITDNPKASHWIHLFHSDAPPGVREIEPEVTVIMTVYNNEDTVADAARSVLASENVSLELLIVDDASTDATGAQLALLEDPRVTILRNERNLGPYMSRNRAAEIARGEFIAIADSDDWSHPSRLAYQRDRLREESSLWACTVSQLRIQPRGLPDLENHMLFLGDGPMSLMFRRSVVDQLGGFDHVRTRGDMEFMSRLTYRFGFSALSAFGAPLVLSTATPFSNSKRFPARSLDDYRAAFRLWHEEAAFSDALYVPLAGRRAPFIAPAELVVDPTNPASD